MCSVGFRLGWLGCVLLVLPINRTTANRIITNQDLNETPVFVKPGDDQLLFSSEVKPWYKHRNDGKAVRVIVLYHKYGKLA